MCTLDLRAEKEEAPREFNVIVSLANTLRYTIMDALLISIIIWFGGSSIFM
jgi:hypothetical protein